MTKLKKKKYILLGFALCFLGSLAGATYAMKSSAYALADTGTENENEFVITDTANEVLAT